MPKYSINGTTHYKCDTCGFTRDFFTVLLQRPVNGKAVSWALIRPALDRVTQHADPVNEEVFVCHCPWCRVRLTVLEGRDPETPPTLPPMLGGRTELLADGTIIAERVPSYDYHSPYPKELAESQDSREG